MSKSFQISIWIFTSKSFKLGFSSMWTKNSQMYKLDLQKAEEPEMKLPASMGSWKKQGNYRKTSISASLTTLKPLTVWITTNCGKFLEMEIPDHLTCLLRNCMQVSGNLDMEQQTDSKSGKRVHQGCILSPCLFNLYAEYIRWNAGLEEAQAGIKIAGRNINNLRYADAADAAAKSLQSCPTLCNPIDSSPPGSPVPGILQARTLEWVAMSFSTAWKWKVKVKSLSCVRLFSDPMDCSLPDSSVHGIHQARVLEWVAIAFSTVA